ncbi:MAG: hypothetical protein AAGA66_12330 [Bacteroidota bacterium]
MNKRFDAVGYMREQRDLLSEKLNEMSKEEVVAYFRRKREGKGVRPIG